MESVRRASSRVKVRTFDSQNEELWINGTRGRKKRAAGYQFALRHP